MNRVIIDDRLCKGCALCTSVCPKKIVEIDKLTLNQNGYNVAKVTDMSLCIACGMCGLICPDSAITVEKEV